MTLKVSTLPQLTLWAFGPALCTVVFLFATAMHGQAAASRTTVQEELGFEQQADAKLKGGFTNPPGDRGSR